MNPSLNPHPQIANELDLLASLVDLQDIDIIEVGCGKAQLARELLARFGGSRLLGLEIDERQHAENLANPCERLSFVHAGAESIPSADERFHLAIMLKSLHHVPLASMDGALAEIWRVLRPGGVLYVSEPVFAGALNEVIRLFNDEQDVRAAAQQALDRAEASGRWKRSGEVRFEMPVVFADFAQFERRMIDVTFADRRLDDATRAEVRRRFDRHLGAGGARFARPMHVRMLRRQPES